MSSGYTAPTPERIYQWMPEQEAARALGITVQAMRTSIIRGSHKARVTAAGIAQVLVCLNPWVPPGDNGQHLTIEPVESPVETSAAPVAARPFAHALAGMHQREKITWMVVVLAFLLLVSLTIHAEKTQAGTRHHADDVRANEMGRMGKQEALLPQTLADSRAGVDVALSAIAKDFADARHRRRIRRSTTAPTTQELLTMDDALPSDLQIGEFFPRFDPDQRTVMAFERQTEARLGAVPASPSDSVPQTGSRFVGAAPASVGQGDWATLQVSRFLVGSDPNGWSVVLFEPNTNAAPPIVNYLPWALFGGASSSAIATGFHLNSAAPNNSDSLGAGNPGPTGGVGVEPPQLGDGPSPAPEPGGLVLFGLAAGPILLKRRRNIPLTQS